MSQATPALRFAVLHHTGVADEHYDLLLETSPDAPLRTWRADAWPLPADGALTRLPDHRRIYLDYEGPIAGGRGEVARVDEGSLHIDKQSGRKLLVRITGRSGQYSIRLEEARENRWIYQCTSL